MKNLIEEKEKRFRNKFGMTDEEKDTVMLNSFQHLPNGSGFRLRQGRDGMTTVNAVKKKIIKNKEKGIQKIRFIVQTLFAILCIRLSSVV